MTVDAQTTATGRRRRARLGTMALVLIGVATACLVVANVIAERRSMRLDLTATGEHRLSPRTAGILSGLSGEYELVLAGALGDATRVPVRALERVRDVLDRIQRESRGRVRVTAIDTLKAGGADEYQRLVGRLIERERAAIERQVTTGQNAIAAAAELARELEGLQTRLLALRERIAGSTPADERMRQYVQQRAGECGVSARAMAEAAKASQEFLVAGTTGVPRVDRVAAALAGPMKELAAGMGDVERTLKDLDGATSGVAGTIGGRSARTADELDRLGRLEVSRVAAVLERSSALVVIGPVNASGRSITAVPLEDLIPADAGAAGADVGRNAEELIGTAVASVASPVTPVVVLIHGQSRGFFDRADLLEAMRRRLGLRGIDVVLWEAAVDKEPPSLSTIDPKSERPVVYVVLNTQSHLGSGRQGESGAERVRALGSAISRLIEDGRSVLLSVYPSTLPTFGDVDPTVAGLKALGIEVDSGRALLRERITPEGRRVEAGWVLRGPSTEGVVPIAAAIAGLPVRLEWPVAVDAKGAEAAGVRTWPLLRTDEAGVWNESEWLSLIQVPMAQHPGVPNPPTSGGPKDESRSGGWTVALAAERTSGERHQRVVVVGSNTWFLGPVLEETTSVDGRLALANPGNAELLEASVYWLAGQDAMIGQSATARAAPLVRTLDERTLSLIRLGLGIGLPGLVLVMGGIWRWRRG